MAYLKGTFPKHNNPKLHLNLLSRVANCHKPRSTLKSKIRKDAKMFTVLKHLLAMKLTFHGVNFLEIHVKIEALT